MLQTPTEGRHIGLPRSRIDGPAKVTGAARYAAEFTAPDLAHGWVVSGAIAKGRIESIDTGAALAVPGVLQVFTHLNRPRVAAQADEDWQDAVAPPGSPLRPLQDDRILYSGQPIALVVATDPDVAQHAAGLLRVEYAPEPHETDLARAAARAYEPPKKRLSPPPPPRGDADGALAAAPVRAGGEYRVAIEHHNPMEPHASTVVWNGDGSITVHDKIQGSQNSHDYVCHVFGLDPQLVRVVSPYVGGAFGSGLRPQYQLFLATMAALELKRSVRVALTRDQMFTFGYRPDTIQQLEIGASEDGKLQAIRHEALAGTSSFEDFQEVVVNWSGVLYQCPNVKLGYKLAKIDTCTPCDMRAPGAPLGVFALESAMDELAHKLRMDPVELRLRNYAERDENEDKPFSSKELRAAYAEGARRFGWSRRSMEPRSMREGRELVGYGMAGGIWEAMFTKSSARAVLTADGRLEIATSTADIGTGTYTILAQIGAEALGLPMEAVTVRLNDSALPKAPVEGGSWTAASSGAAVQAACDSVRNRLLSLARGMEGSPLANAGMDRVGFADGRVALLADPNASVGFAEAMHAAGVARIEELGQASPGKAQQQASAYTHSAIFCEARVDEELGVIRIPRITIAVAAGRILNPKTARSQIIGGVVFGLGMALEEESMPDHALGRFMNHDFAEYHVPVQADVGEIDVVFVEEKDEQVSPLGVKGLGEIGIVGTAAAVANAIHHATGRRLRELPITIDRLMGTDSIPH